ncbi:MbeD/MobD family mobilization/exclusion protein [Candidatus Palauibacter sp.]|uniref:MbeD/MobD family mobilization/exclusion protein n=1 Tax=Candidatus Palauibacter sp. TaxID=3101350 RepID=UPI003B51F5A6
MTDLERQLTTALERLSAEYETEQRRHSEHVEALRQQVEALQRQVERLSGRVTDLARYSGTYGAGPGSRWR